MRARHVFAALVPSAVLAAPLGYAFAARFTDELRTFGDTLRAASVCFLIELLAAILAAVAVQFFRTRRAEAGAGMSLAVARASSLLSLLLLVAWGGWMLYAFVGSLAHAS